MKVHSNKTAWKRREVYPRMGAPALLSLVFLCVLCASVVSPASAQTTITGTVKDASGTALASGTIIFTLSQEGTVSDPALLVVQPVVTCTITSGVIGTCSLRGNDEISPAGTFYRVRIISSGGRTFLPERTYTITGATWDIGTATPLASDTVAATAYQIVQDEGANLTQRQKLNFAGAGITCTDDSANARTDCTITGGGGGGATHQIDGVALTAQDPINFLDTSEFDWTNPAAGDLSLALKSAGVADSKLAQITTASKVSGAALTSLGSVPAGAGDLPLANLTDGTGFLKGAGGAGTPAYAAIADSDVPDTITINLAATATALAADPANCAANNLAAGITAAGVAEGCADPILETELDTIAELNTQIADATIEVQANKNAASGYAGLTGSTKLQLSQGQEVWAIADLSDVTAKSGNTTVVGTTSGALGAGNCAEFDASGNLVDSGAGCGGGAGDNISVNGTAAVDADFDDSTPAAPANGFNMKWQKDALTPNNISAYFDTTTMATSTWGSGSAITLTYDVGATDPVVAYTSGNIKYSGATTYTFEGGATDPVWTPGNNQMDLSTGALLEGGNAVPNSTDHLGFFAATTSAQLAGVLSDESGTGLVLLQTSPTIVTPTIAATGWTNATHAHAAANSGGQVAHSDLSGIAATDHHADSILETELDTEAELEAQLTDVTDVLTDAAGSCTNQVVTAVNDGAAPTCSNVSSAMISDGVVASADLATANKTFKCSFVLFDDSGLKDTDDINSISNCSRPGRAITITEVIAETDAGSPVINLQRDDGTPANILSSDCTATTGGATCTIAAAEDNIAATDKIDFVAVSGMSGANRVSILIEYTVD